jgi:hypothetical protein
MRWLGLLSVLALAVSHSHSHSHSSSSAPQLTRVFYLQEMETKEATTLLRTEAQVRRLAAIPGRSVLVVSDVEERIVRAESLLRERHAISRTAEPHGPLDFERLAVDVPVGRIFRVDRTASGTAAMLLRAIYQMRGVIPQEGGVSARAAEALLDASESLLRELELLAE